MNLNFDGDKAFYYTVLVTRHLPNPFLLYQSNRLYKAGQIVSVPVRGNLVDGIVWQKIESAKVNQTLNPDKETKEIVINVIRSFTLLEKHNSDTGFELLESVFCLSQEHINYIKLIISNSFNTPDVVLSSILQPFNTLVPKDIGFLFNYIKDHVKSTGIMLPTNPETALETLSQGQFYPSKDQANKLEIQQNNELKNQVRESISANELFSLEHISFSPIGFQQYIKVRIMNLIRSYINVCSMGKKDEIEDQKRNQINLLFIFPEKKLLNKYWLECITKEISEFVKTEFPKISLDFNKYIFTGDKSKSNKETVSSILKQGFANFNHINKYNNFEAQKLKQNLADSIDSNINTLTITSSSNDSKENSEQMQENSTMSQTSYNVLNNEETQIVSKNGIDSPIEFEINIYFTTKVGLFLPFDDLDETYLIDESNSFYIQEQNSFYYDAREIVYYLAKAHNSKLYLVSGFPSVRMFNFDLENQNKNSNTKDITPNQISKSPLESSSEGQILEQLSINKTSSQDNINIKFADSNIDTNTETISTMTINHETSYNVQNEDKLADNLDNASVPTNRIENINIQVSERTRQNTAPSGIFSWDVEKLLLDDVD